MSKLLHALPQKSCCRPQIASRKTAVTTRAVLRNVTVPARLRLLSSLSRAVEVQGSTARFETLAGRSAMLGASVALVLECLDPSSRPLLGSISGMPDLSFTTFISLGGAVVVLAAALATVQAQAPLNRTRAPLLEAVLTSLTAAQGSAAGVSGSQVDSMVDHIMTTSLFFSDESLRQLTDGDVLAQLDSLDSSSSGTHSDSADL